jgi:drug/metabolite transporter (DMT)-like permease
MAHRVLLGWKHFPPNVRGILWIALAGLTVTTTTLIVKTLGGNLSIVQILFVLQLPIVAVMLPRLITNPKEVLRTDNAKLLMLRALLSLAGTFTGFVALINLPLSDAVAISFSRGFFAGILAVLLLREVYSFQQWLFLLASFVGVMIITRPSLAEVNVHMALALGSAALIGLGFVVMRSLCVKERLATFLTYLSLSTASVLAIPAALVWTPPTATEWLLLICAGSMNALSHGLYFAGFRAGETMFIIPAEYLQLVYAAVFSLVIFGEVPHWATWAGSAVILMASLGAACCGRR